MLRHHIVASLLLSLLFCTGFCSKSIGEEVSDDAYSARDICVGVGANFVNAPKDTEVSFESGKFRVVGKVGGKITIFEGAVNVGSLSDFTYTGYNSCVDRILSSFEQKRKKSELDRSKTAFALGYSLNKILYVGTCLRPLAQMGLWLNNQQEGGQSRISDQDFNKFLQAFDRSLKPRFAKIGVDYSDVSLAENVSYYRFVQDRQVPFFETVAIEEINSRVSNLLNGDSSSYYEVGKEAGKLSRIWELITGVAQAEHRAAQVYDPNIGYKIQSLDNSYQCLSRTYIVGAQNIESVVSDLGLALDVSVPDVKQLRYMTDEQMAQHNFDSSYTFYLRSKINQ